MRDSQIVALTYTPTNTRERNAPRAHLLICTHVHTQHALKYRCAYTYMCNWSIKKQKNTYTHKRNNTNMHKYANIRILIHAYIYIQPFMCDGVYIKLNNPESHTQWHCPGINPIISAMCRDRSGTNRMLIALGRFRIGPGFRWHCKDAQIFVSL